MEQIKNEVVDIPLKEVTLPRIDVKKYIGKKERIKTVETMKGKYGYMLKLTTGVIDIIEKKEGVIELKASRVFGLHEDKNGSIGWAKDTELGKYLEKMGVDNPKKLLNKEVTIQTKEKDGIDYLTFT